MNTFENKYIKHLASISNTYSPVLLKSRYARLILSYKGIEIGKPRRSKYAVLLDNVKQLSP